jgi:hypothetical protein
MPATPRAEQLANQAQFVFQGTVTQVKGSTVAQIPASDRTAVVRVDRVIHAPPAVSNLAGDEVTVQLPPGEPVTEGQTLVFFTVGWVFGDRVAVKSLGQEEVNPATLQVLAGLPGDPVHSLQARQAVRQAAQADLVVAGRVSAVRLPAAEARARATAGAGRTAERISEHAPLWQEAVIDVDEVLKGGRAKKVVVRFPASTDVRWHKAPKFQTGQEGVFLLHKEQLAREVPRTAAAELAPEEYTALHPADFQPLDELPRIKLAVQGGAG